MKDFDLSEIRELNRKKYYNIWQLVKAGETLKGEDQIIGELMKQHEEYYSEWESTDFEYEYDPETEANPFMHIMIDTIVMNQMAKNDPRQTRLTYNKLTARGYSHLEAIHKIDLVIAEEIWEIITNRKVFNENNYITKLKKLK